MTEPVPRGGKRPTIVLMFPGQSSRSPAMIEKIVAADRDSAALLATASGILGRDLGMHYRADNPGIFATNRDVQVGVFVANHLHLDLLRRAGVESEHSLGLSLGEYNHLVHIGALSFAAALRLVDRRGRIYDAGPRGVMVSVFPVEADDVENAIDAAGMRGRCAIALYNSPRQQVLSGERDAVERVVAELDAAMLIEAVEIEPAIPMHAPVFEPVAPLLRQVLAEVEIEAPLRAYVPNRAGAVIGNATAEQIRACLTAHVYQPVRWRESIEAVAASVSSPCFVEVGPGSVLFNLFGRGWVPGQRARTDAAEDWPGHFDAVTAALRDAC